MSGYRAIASTTLAVSSSFAAGVKAGSYQIKLARIELSSATSSGITVNTQMFAYTGATLSGGSTVTPAPFRDGAAASSATAKSGGTISGTSNILHQEGAQIISSPLSSTYQPAFDLILSPGNAIWVLSTSTTGSGSVALFTIAIYFEELHLARST